MRNDSWNCVVQQINQLWKNCRPIKFLELWLHIIRNLSNCMAWSIPQHCVWISHESNYHLKNRWYFLWLINVLSNLRQSHHCCVLVPPVWLSQQCLNSLWQNAHDLLLTDWVNESVNGSHTESCCFKIFVVLHVFIVTFWWAHPFLLNFFIDVNHVMEDHLNNIC